MKFPNPFELFNKDPLDKTIKENLENEGSTEPVNLTEVADYYETEAPSVSIPINSESIDEINQKLGNKLSSYTQRFKAPENKFWILFSAVIMISFSNLLMYYYAFYPLLRTKDERNSKNQLYVEENIKNTENSTWPFEYGLKILCSLYGFFYLILIFTMKFAFKKEDWLNTFIVSVILYFIIVGFTIALLMIPSFVEIFENTVGFAVLNAGVEVDELFNKNFKSRIFPAFNIDLSFLFTLFQICSFSESYEKFAVEVCRNNKQSQDISVFYDIKYKNVDENNETIDYNDVKKYYSDIDYNIRLKLFELISKKYVVGHFTWTFFATMITFFASINALI